VNEICSDLKLNAATTTFFEFIYDFFFFFCYEFAHGKFLFMNPFTETVCEFVYGSHDSSVGIALGYGLDDWGSRVRLPAGAGNFSLHQHDSEAHPASCSTDTGSLSVGIKRPGREAYHSSPSSAEVNNTWRYTSTPQYVFMAWCLVKHRDKFIFTFTSLF
jgi:hypothetical protein